MVSHVTVVPASSQSGRETIRSLLASNQGVSVRAIYRDPSKAPAEFTANPRFSAVKGDVSSGIGLDFSESGAVLYVPPPTHDGTDQAEFATRAAQNVAAALKKANVKKLILHSAMGAQHESGIGVLKLNHISDTLLKDVVPQVVIIKPGWFFEMWAPAVKSMQSDNPSFESTFSPPDYKIPQVSVRDVGEVCAQALLDESPKASPFYVDLIGPRDYSSLDIKHAIEEVTGKEGTLVTIPKEELPQFFSKVVPEKYVPEYVEMITAIHPGGIIKEQTGYGDNVVRGKLELVDALRNLL